MAASAKRWGHGLIAMSLVFCGALSAQAAPSVEWSAEVGLGGWVVPGKFAPLRIDLTAASEGLGLLEVTVPQAGGGRVTHRRAIRLAPGARQQITFEVTVTDPRRPITVRLRRDGDEIARQEIRVGSGRVAEGIVAALTPERAGLEFLASGSRRRAAYLVEATMPSRWQFYDAADLVVLDALLASTLLPAQQEALVGWVAQGGRLLVVPRDGLPAEPWLAALLPARVGPPAHLPGFPFPLLRLSPEVPTERTGEEDFPLAVRRRFGLGLVELWAFDPFSPAARAWPGRVGLWQSLLATPGPTAAVPPALIDELPRTRPLPGSTQVALAGLSVAYLAAMRLVLRRWSGLRGGWILVPAVVGVFATALYAVASGAREAARSIAQVSVVEVLPEARRARVTTVVSLIAPYGGSVTAHLPAGAAVRLLEDGWIVLDESARTVTGGARRGSVALEVRQIIEIDLYAAVVDSAAAPQLLFSGDSPPPVDGLLARGRQIYRLGSGPVPRRMPLDPAGWTTWDRPGVLGTDLASRAVEVLLAHLAQRPEELWLVGRHVDDRTALRLPGGGMGESSRLLLLPVTLP
ncbi:MAG: hypothetical protein QN141_09910 [Armatimonadota bacterium]|nr:hypothetical protein [Armatimonadota bacterium]MDR7451586.1 hypothetical protein [Armatimonadota bacterium]MDR7467694.1 hypothetical protein [Armatimonadota bacterium]MDR7492555.1 hypothetical protein [Armatimonadota bacterium]MDR7500498.1 hypothetical protein [Armatimonadota bacterium]